MLTHLALPVLTIALVMAGSLSRYVRSATLDVMGSDYLRNARAMGSTMGTAMLHHGLRNGAVPVISILGIELATAFLGAVVIEAVFALPGLGSMLLKAIAQHDYPNIQGILFVSTLLVLIVGFIADVVQRLVDPRLRQPVAGLVSGPEEPDELDEPGASVEADRLEAPSLDARARRRRSLILVVGLVLVGTHRPRRPRLAGLAAVRPERHVRRPTGGALRSPTSWARTGWAATSSRRSWSARASPSSWASGPSWWAPPSACRSGWPRPSRAAGWTTRCPRPWTSSSPSRCSCWPCSSWP